MPFGLQPIHLLVIALVALVIFGPRRLPQLGRWLGRTFSEFKKGARDMAEGFTEETGTKKAASPEAAAGNFCTACGAANSADARFCNKCGISLPA